MKIRWSTAAADDLVHIVDHIRQDNVSAALSVAKTIRQEMGRLRSFPRLGRPGRMEGTRELVLAPLPFITIYRVKEEFIEIVRILHGAQRWP